MLTKLLKRRFYRPPSSEATVRIRPVFDDFHVLRMRGSYEYPRHCHSNYEIILVECGPYRCELNKAELTLDSGEILLIKPGDWHQDHLHNGQRHYVIHFHLAGGDAGEAETALFTPAVTPDVQAVRGDHLENAALVRELRRESLGARAYGGAIQDCLLEAFFWRLVRALEPKSLSPSFRRWPKTERLREQLTRFADEACDRRASVGDFAKAAGCSVRSLSATCRATLGCSPAQLLLRARIQRAEDLLRFGGYSSKEVSDRLGFANPFHFSRAFRRIRGFPPSTLGGKI